MTSAATRIDHSTIFALSTAPGRAGVAVVRLSGTATGPAIRTLSGDLPDPRIAALRSIKSSGAGDLIDRGLILWFPGPESFTGEDCGEFHIHGGRAVIAALLDALGKQPGLRLAEPGEFARRAFENGKLDLTAAEGLADLIDAETEAQRLQAVRQAGGALSRLYEAWRQTLLEALALQEAGIDFSDEQDIAADASAQAEVRVRALLVEISGHLADSHRGEILRDGFQVAIVGPPNAGKSSLMNSLACRDVAIVSSEAGTTRDVIDVKLDLGGFPIVVSDTAGLRIAEGEVEGEGIRRAIRRASCANLVIWLTDASGPEELPPEALLTSTMLRVSSKCDLMEPGDIGDGSAVLSSDLLVSARTGEGLRQLVEELAERAEAVLGTAVSQAAPTRQRHQEQLSSCIDALTSYLNGNAPDVELRAEDLRQAALALGRLTGRIDVEDVLGEVFSSFCIGK